MNIQLRVPVFKDGKFDHFNCHKLEVFGKSYSFGNCHFIGNYELKEPELFTNLKGYQGDIIDVCIFLVSPENPDNDQHFRGVIEFENGKFVFIIHKYLKFDGSKTEWVDIQSRYLPFYDEELDEEGTYTVPYFDFLAMSGNIGEFCDDNVEIIGNIYEHPDLLQNAIKAPQS